ncbi:MAG: hypothetical protein PHT80_14775 [Lentisphaeria bacterium]|nr:hypothetical protein [Lentisphaeria bacterium]
MHTFRNTLLVLGGVAAAGVTAAEMKTPETSSLFRRHVEPASGVVSYILDTRIAENQQSLYFTQQSMTDDGRFVVFDISGGERGNRKSFALLDFLTDTLTPLEIRGSIPFLDPATADLYWFQSDGLYRLALSAEARKSEKLCDVPVALREAGSKVHRLVTHTTLTSDRKKAFLDARVDDRFIQGMLTIATGEFEKWGEADFHINHGQVNPTNDRMALCAYEVSWTDKDGVLHRIEKIDGVYPRLQLLEPGKRRMIPPLFNYATHEYWAPDGKGFYYCGQGVIYHDLATDKAERLAPVKAAHATMTADKRFFTYDYSVGPWYRGCAWQVGFYNRETGKEVFIFQSLPAFNTKENPSTLHPDPHPQFVCGEKYIICTINHGDGRMDLAITPVAQLADMTR